MKFEKVEIELPTKIKKLYDAIYRIEKNSAIAGGYLVDLYLGKKSNSVDFFIDEKSGFLIYQLLKKVFKIETKKKMVNYRFTILGVKDVIEGEYEDYTVRFFFTKKGKENVKHFDLRFKEFYYHNDKCFASSDAISDLKKGEIYLGVIFHPIITYTRLINAILNYNLKVNQASFARLAESINLGNYTKNSIEEYAKSIKEESTKETILKLVSHLESPISYLEFDLPEKNPAAIFYLNQYNREITRGQFDSLYEKEKIFFKKSNTYYFKEQVGLKELSNRYDKIRKMVKKNAIKMMFEFPKDIKFWVDNLKSDAYLLTIFPTVLNKMEKRAKKEETKKAIDEIRNSYSQMLEFQKELYRFQSHIEVTVTNENCLKKGVEIEEYLNDEVLQIAIAGFGHFIINKKTKTIITFSMKKLHLELLTPSILDILETYE